MGVHWPTVVLCAVFAFIISYVLLCVYLNHLVKINNQFNERVVKMVVDETNKYLAKHKEEIIKMVKDMTRKS